MKRIAVFIAAAIWDLSAHAAIAPEQSDKEIARIARYLKPIPDSRWQTIAGEKMTETYTIHAGDTLSDISKRLFGDPKYWPKIWALNNDSITNPHQLKPGKMIAFRSGTGTSLPSVSVQDTPVQEPWVDSSGRSLEWKHLPRQKWENTQNQFPDQVDTLGFDKRSRVKDYSSRGIELHTLIASNPIEPLGIVVGARSEGQNFSLNDTVFIQTEKNLQLGEVYALSQEPEEVDSEKRDIRGFSYPLLGKVKITGVRDHLFIATVLATTDLAPRGTILIPLPPRAQEPAIIPGPSALEAEVIFDKSSSTFATAQHKPVYIDRGTEDGVQLGMIFRAYEHKDPVTEETITESNIISYADIVVIQTSEKFSQGLVLTSTSLIDDHTPITLLVDVTDVIRSRKKQVQKTVGNGDKELEELDRLDTGDGIGPKELRELEQLEKWKSNPEPEPSAMPSPIETPAPAPSPEPSPMPSATESMPPPPTAPIVPEPTSTPEPTALPEPAAPVPPSSLPEALPPTPEALPVPPPALPETPSPKSDESNSLDQLLNQ